MTYVISLGPQGRLVIPAVLRKQVHLEVGDELVVSADGKRLVLEPRQVALNRMVGLFADDAPKHSLVDELLADRRAEVARDRKHK